MCNILYGITRDIFVFTQKLIKVVTQSLESEQYLHSFDLLIGLSGNCVWSVLKLFVKFCLIALLIAHVHRKVRSLSKARGSHNQLQNNCINYEFN